MTAAALPPGFQFYPSDEELVSHFLHRKSLGLLTDDHLIIPTLHLSHYNPWDLDGKALLGGKQWYFFSRLTRNRATMGGYWDEEGEDETVVSSSSESSAVGIKKTFVFYVGEAPDGVKTSWVMNEYHLGGSRCTRSSKNRGQHRIESGKWVVCRVYDTPVRLCDDGIELSCLDEAFLSVDDDDLDDISWPN